MVVSELRTVVYRCQGYTPSYEANAGDLIEANTLAGKTLPIVPPLHIHALIELHAPIQLEDVPEDQKKWCTTGYYLGHNGTFYHPITIHRVIKPPYAYNAGPGPVTTFNLPVGFVIP